MTDQEQKIIIEAALFAVNTPLTLNQMMAIFDEEERPDRSELRVILGQIKVECAGHGYELMETGSGFRFQVIKELKKWMVRLWKEKPQRYSRAMIETLAIIAYRQPVTRGDIENIRGVNISSSILKTLQEREWVRIVGQKEVPGRPLLYGTNKQFLDHFNLRSLSELPKLLEIKDGDENMLAAALQGQLAENLEESLGEPKTEEATQEHLAIENQLPEMSVAVSPTNNAESNEESDEESNGPVAEVHDALSSKAVTGEAAAAEQNEVPVAVEGVEDDEKESLAAAGAAP